MPSVPDRPVATEFDPKRDWVAVPTAWSYETERRASLDAARRRAADDVERAIFDTFPAISVRMRAALFLAYRLSAPIPACGMLGTALALAARDAFMARSWPPPGRRKDDERSDAVADYLTACALRAEGDTLAQDLLWATVLATVPDAWVPHQPIASRLSHHADEGEGIAAVELLYAQLRGPAVGGRAWALRNSRDSLTAIVADLAVGRPAMVALHRAPLGGDRVEIGLAYRYDPMDGERCRLLVYDPLTAFEPIELDLSFHDRGLTVIEHTEDGDRPPILAIRHIDSVVKRPRFMSGWFARLRPVWRLRRWFGRHQCPQPSGLAADGQELPPVEG